VCHAIEIAPGLYRCCGGEALAGSFTGQAGGWLDGDGRSFDKRRRAAGTLGLLPSPAKPMARPVWTPTDAQRRASRDDGRLRHPRRRTLRACLASRSRPCASIAVPSSTRVPPGANSKVADFLFYGICGGTGQTGIQRRARPRHGRDLLDEDARGGWSENQHPTKHTGVANGDPIEVEVGTVRETSHCAELLASLPPEQLAAFLKQTSDRELEGDRARLGLVGAAQPTGAERRLADPGCCWPVAAFGKTRSGAECIRKPGHPSPPPPDRAGRADRSRCPRMSWSKGERAGLLAIGPPQQRPQYEPTKAQADLAERGPLRQPTAPTSPERLRGAANTMQRGCDENSLLAVSRGVGHADVRAAALGPDPRVVVTTTPKPIKINPRADRRPHHGDHAAASTYDNRANLRAGVSAADHSQVRGHPASAGKSSTPRYWTTYPVPFWSPRADRGDALASPSKYPGLGADRRGDRSRRCRPARTPTRPALSSAGKDANGPRLCFWPISPVAIRRPNGHALQLPSTVSTRPIALSRRSTTAADMVEGHDPDGRPECPPTTKCTLHAAR